MMQPLLSAQQTSYYTKNRSLELEELLSVDECKAFASMMEEPPGRDLWRKHSALKELLLSRKMGKLALHLTGKAKLQLACDQWFSPGFFKAGKKIKFKEFFSIQGVDCVFLVQLQPGKVEKPPKAPTLGMFPFPQGREDTTDCQGSALIVNADLLLSWPDLSTEIGLYAVAYSLVPAVYIQNSNDPAAHFLKQFGYGYGDPLTHLTNPIIAK